MKELYISPEMEILCFAPIQKLALTTDWGTWANTTNTSDGVSTGETQDGDVIVTVPTDPLN